MPKDQWARDKAKRIGQRHSSKKVKSRRSSQLSKNRKLFEEGRKKREELGNHTEFIDGHRIEYNSPWKHAAIVRYVTTTNWRKPIPEWRE